MSNFSSKIAGIILTGGKSRRMGRPKFSLSFGPETILERVARLLGQAVSPLAIVGAPDQDLPELGDAILLSDPEPDQGPLLGLCTGLKHLSQITDWVFVTGCDAPFFCLKHLHLLAHSRTDQSDVIIPVVEGQHYPLCALYRSATWRNAADLLNGGERRLLALLDVCEVVTVSEEQLRQTDPDLLCLMNVNTEQSYRDALQRAGLIG